MSDELYEGIAIIGMAGRFPGAETVEELWTNLLAGKETVSIFSDAELAESGLDGAALRNAGQYVAARGILKDADCFDAAFFGVHPKEAEVMDPQHRLFLEICWAALERAGYAPNHTQSCVGVFAGATFNTYYLHALHQRQDLVEMMPELVMFGNEKDYIATRVAYKLGLKGPAVNVSTACSTSMVAVAQACQSLLTYQCDMALAGGASVAVPQKRGYFYDEGNIGSIDGHTRTFDVQASGTTFSNGIGVVVLKRLADAIAAGDRIFAVIKAAALNNDGSHRVSFGAPGVEGQSEVVAMAHALAGVDPETISYVEAHGTATPLGDPIEVAALTKAFRMGTQARQFCAIGSIKTNIGHLDAAAGVTGLIKVALSLHHRVLPASLHFTQPNPKLDLENSPFFVNTALREWTTKPGMPRRAGVSSFGTGGTNAHLVLEEAPAVAASGPSRGWQLLTLSARTLDGLDRAAANLSAHLKELGHGTSGDQAAALADVAFTLQTGRAEFVHRRIVVCSDAADGAAALASADPKRVFSHQQQAKNAPVVFMFPGQGAQYAGMGAELYRCEPVFRAEVDHCADVLKSVLGLDLRTLLFPAAGAEQHATDQLVQTRFTQPALFTIEYALAKLWMSWGIKPTSMIGHSVGEYVAGCLAGVISLDDALTLVARRGALVQAQPGGAMLAVRLPEKDVTPLLKGQMAIAAINSPSLCVVAGPHESITALADQLAQQNVTTRHLHTSHAFHSPMMDPVLAPFTELLRQVKLGEPQIPYVSNVTAKWITAAEAQSPEYWASHVRDTVRFADGIAELAKTPSAVLLEVGPGQTLTTLGRQHPSKSAEQLVVASMPLTGADEQRGLLETLGRLWMAGADINWEGFYADERRHRVVLPSYPFERKRYWPDAPAAGSKAATAIQHAPTASVAAAAPAQSAVAVESSQSTASPALEAPVASRADRLLTESRVLLEEISGYDLSTVDPSSDLLELGLDSLLLTQAATTFQRKFGIRITFRQLMEELNSLSAIASYLDANLPANAFAPPVVAARPAAAPAPAAQQTVGGAPASVLEQLLAQQQQLTSQLMQMLGQSTGAAPASTTPLAAPVPATTPAPAVWTAPKSEGKSHGPFRPMDRGASNTFSQTQTQALERLIERYTRRTPESKRLAEKNRPMLADPRSAAGFKQAWKEMVYPIYTTRSDGSRVWDVDGNEYIDFVMGFGASLFGHRPPFVVDAVHQQLDRGFEIGPIQPVVGEVAALIREFTGMERVGFTNTGSEAVLAATRVSRTVTGRDKIAVFAGAYHGIFDEVLFRPIVKNGEPRAAAIAPGIAENALGQLVVLDYGNPQSLDYLRARGSEIAAVMVEPVQSRRLDLQPKEFLHELRRITEQTETALIFDEVVTGFRVHPGGAQAHFGVRADLATYGKVVGGGMPIGVVTGTAKYMDALDGGKWQYGDTSFPEVGVTFFAGTFVRHPLVLAAAKAVLLHLKEQGPGLQEKLNERTARLAGELRSMLNEYDAPYELSQFTSLMHLTPPSDQKLSSLLFYLLRQRGIHIYDNRAFVMTTAHSEADLQALTHAFRDSLQEMRESEFYTPSGGGHAKGPATETHSESKVAAAPAIPAAGAFPLTEAQKEIWLASQMSDAAAIAYNESLRLEFRGAFDADLFRQAARQVVQRHPILMASFASDGASQKLNPGASFDVPLLDFSGESEPERQRKMTEVIDGEVAVRFDLTTGPLVRARIVRLSSDRHTVVWTAHHIVCDGWSGGLIVSELSKIYSALKEGRQAELDEPIPFSEYAVASTSETPEAVESMAFWQKQFADIPAPLDLPADRPRPPVRTSRASTTKRTLRPTVHESIKRVAAQQRTTMVTLLLAAYKTLLFRLTGQSDLVVGMGAAGQAMTGKTCMVGHCINLLPIRTQLNPAASFRDNLLAVKKNVLDAYDHQEATVGGILSHLKVARSADRPTLVEVIFNVDRDAGEISFDGLDFAIERNAKGALHYDLFFNFVEGPKRLYVECDYNTDLFDASTIDRWLAHCETLLESIAADPSELPGLLRMQRPSELKTLTVDWNDTNVSYPTDRCLFEFIEDQAARTPAAPAVSFDGNTLSYAELNARANQLAHYLRVQGVGPERFVAVCFERSLEMVVALLGIVKAGGAYVPLDPEHPQERLSLLLKDLNPVLVLTQGKFASRIPRGHSTLLLDVDWNRIATEVETNPSSITNPKSPVYLIYTSGSTGRPKAVINIHEGIVNRLLWMQDAYRLDGGDRVLQKTPYTFDVSVWEFFWPLMTGACLVVARPGGHQDPVYLATTIETQRISTLHFVPSMLEAFLEVPGLERLQSVRRVICSGEALGLDVQTRFFERLPNVELHNLYGPTEASVDVTFWQCARENRYPFVPIGRPIANTQIYVLDRHMNPTPIGVPGELHIGGIGVARGYLGQDALTAERFVPDVISSKPGARLYKTGDLARFNADGVLEYLGRLDTQVKIRGLRIELGEIEAAIREQSGVRQAAVSARPDSRGDKRLVAYVVPEDAKDAALEQRVREALKRRLPEYMVPPSFVMLDSLPLTSSGKVDRKALPAPEYQASASTQFSAPRDPLEQMLARLWSKVLKVRHVGVHDNFFDLGGHSILAVRILIEIEKQCGRRVPIATMIQAPTIAELADVIRRDDWTPSWTSLVPIQPGGSKTPLFLMHSHGGNVLEYYTLTKHLDQDQPVYALQARGLDGHIVRGQTLEQMVATYLTELKTLQPEGPYQLGGFCFGGLLALEAAQQLRAAGDEVSLVIMIQTTHPAVNRFAPHTSSLQRIRYRTTKRIDLERENLKNRGTGYFQERGRRMLDMAVARTTIAFDQFMGKTNGDAAVRSMPYILESLSIEHDLVFEKYVPRPYSGDVLLFRAARQLQGLSADEFLGWKGVLRGRFEVKEAPGHQQNMLDEPNVKVLADEISAQLNQSAASSTVQTPDAERQLQAV